MTDPIFLDFETEAIGPRPEQYPPQPVGLAVLDRTHQFETKYWAFGHDHNCTSTITKNMGIR